MITGCTSRAYNLDPQDDSILACISRYIIVYLALFEDSLTRVVHDFRNPNLLQRDLGFYPIFKLIIVLKEFPNDVVVIPEFYFEESISLIKFDG